MWFGSRIYYQRLQNVISIKLRGNSVLYRLSNFRTCLSHFASRHSPYYTFIFLISIGLLNHDLLYKANISGEQAKLAECYQTRTKDPV